MGCICIPSTVAGLARLMLPWHGCPVMHMLQGTEHVLGENRDATRAVAVEHESAGGRGTGLPLRAVPAVLAGASDAGVPTMAGTVRGNPHALFGKRPTEKDPNHGHLAGGRLHSTGGSWRRSTRTMATGVAPPFGKPAEQRPRAYLSAPLVLGRAPGPRRGAAGDGHDRYVVRSRGGSKLSGVLQSPVASARPRRWAVGWGPWSQRSGHLRHSDLRLGGRQPRCDRKQARQGSYLWATVVSFR
jgi:hypothetical protein